MEKIVSITHHLLLPILTLLLMAVLCQQWQEFMGKEKI